VTTSKKATIIAHAELTEIDRNRLTFKVEAYDGDKKIGDGTHKRAIIKTGG
jgi:fluoroacetyl-CoA thioesterase